MRYVIRNMYNDLFWSNSQGWVSRPLADTFSKFERDTYSLPMEGVWAVCFETAPPSTAVN